MYEDDLSSSPGQDPRASLTVSLAQGGECARRGWDPQWPECGHVILTGTILTQLQVTPTMLTTVSQFYFLK